MSTPQVDDAKQRQGRTQADIIVELCKEVSLFKTASHEVFVSFEVDGHTENWPLKSEAFRRWVSRRFYETNKKVPGSQGLQDALNVIASEALYKGAQLEVFTRIGEHNEKFYFDLGDPAWKCVEIDINGWRISNKCPVKFIRSRGMLPIPLPIPNTDLGSLSEFKGLLNIESETDYHLLLGWMLGALNPKGPYPLLVLQGEQGSCKSTTAQLIRKLLDNNVAPLRSPPRCTDDLMIAAKNGSVIVLDNLSGIQPWLSDDLCRLSTGGGLSKRQLFSDADEILFMATRPVILTGIDDLLTRGDLADRSITVQLPVVSESKRRPLEEINNIFLRIAPLVMGALLTGLSSALKGYRSVQLDSYPRMADFARFVTAGEVALGLPARAFINAYRQNQKTANETLLGNSPISALITEIAAGNWEGTASELLEKMNFLTLEKPSSKSWPSTPKVLSDWLRRLAPNLRQSGVEIQWRQSSGNNSKRLISIRSCKKACDAPPNATPSLKPCADSVDEKQIDSIATAEIENEWMDLFQDYNSTLIK